MSDNYIYDLKERWIDAQLSIQVVLDEIQSLSDEDREKFEKVVVW